MFEILISLLLLTFVSYQAIHSITQDKLKTSIVSSLRQLTDKMTLGYLNLSQVSQQMSAQGTVGSLLEIYFFPQSNFDKYDAGQQILQSLVNLTFANSDIICREYYDPVTGSSYFSDCSTSKKFSPNRLNTLSNNGSITYQALHQSSTQSLTDDQVISIGRTMELSDGRQLIIYLESKYQVRQILEMFIQTQKMHYILLQLDFHDRIQYSSDSAFNIGDTFAMSGTENIGNCVFGNADKYVGAASRTSTGFTNVLLVPNSDYNREYYLWIRAAGVIILLAVIAFSISTIAISRLIYRPLTVFSKEMKKFGNGDLDEVKVTTGVLEYDELFRQFNTLKKRICRLMCDVDKKEQEKHKLEIEKIYYQINPHFLMNTIHSINWLARMHHQPDIENFTMELNYVMAYSLGKIDRIATIRTEIRMTESYLRLQKMRYDFTFRLEAEEGDYLDTPTARMILQPIVENCILHGLGDKACLLIRIFHLSDRNLIAITVEDNGKGLTREELTRLQGMLMENLDSSRPEGIGLKYVQSMLESFYGDKALITINSEISKGTKVTLLLPEDREKCIFLLPQPGWDGKGRI